MLFHLGDLISIGTGRLYSPSGIGGVYEILNFMCGESLSTAQLPRVGREAEPYILEQFPWLREIRDEELAVPDDVNAEEFVAVRLALLAQRYGEWHDVRPMHGEDHEHLTVVEDVLRINPDMEVLPFEIPKDDEDSISPYGDISWK